jgi:hypothetical protein
VFSVPRLRCFALLWVRVASSAATADRGGHPALGCSTKTPALLALLVARRRVVAPFRPGGDGLLRIRVLCRQLGQLSGNTIGEELCFFATRRVRRIKTEIWRSEDGDAEAERRRHGVKRRVIQIESVVSN